MEEERCAVFACIKKGDNLLSAVRQPVGSQYPLPSPIPPFLEMNKRDQSQICRVIRYSSTPLGVCVTVLPYPLGLFRFKFNSLTYLYIIDLKDQSIF